MRPDHGDDEFIISCAPRPRRPVVSLLRLMLQSFPLLSGVGRILDRIPGIRSLEPDSRSVVARLRSGELIVVHPGDFIGRHVYWTGDYDRKITWICRRILRPGDTALDIGANNGAVALAAAGVVGPGGSVHAVEPQPDLAAMLRESVRLNAFSHMTVHEIALSNTSGEAFMHIPDSNSGEATLSRSDRAGRDVAVKLVHAGEFLEELRVSRVRLMKIDVEDHEAMILAAAAEALRRVLPDVIVFESHDHGTPFWERDAIRTLASLGYRLHQAPKAMLWMSLTFIPTGLEPPFRGWDFVAIAPGDQRVAIEKRLRVRDAPRD